MSPRPLTRAGSRLRRLGAALALAGAALLAPTAVTLAWQEPVSALIAASERSGLEAELATLEREQATVDRDSRSRVAPAAARRVEGRRRAEGVRRIPRAIRRAGQGAAIGRIELPRGGGAHHLVHGTSAGALRRGPGRYEETGLPGEGRTVAFAGHRTTWLAPFRHIGRLRPGDEIAVRMPYGRFVYRVRGSRRVDASEVSVLRERTGEHLVLTACDPPFSATGRIVVTAALVRGG